MATLATKTISTFIMMISMIVNLATAASHPHSATIMMQARSTTNDTDSPFDLGVFWESQSSGIQVGLIVGALIATILAGTLFVYILIFLGCAAICISHPLSALVKWCRQFTAGPAVENWLHFWSQPSPPTFPGPLGTVGSGTGVYELWVVVNSPRRSPRGDLEAGRSDASINGSTVNHINTGETPAFEDHGVTDDVSDVDVSVLVLPA